MRPICDQDFNWATRRPTPVHLRALSGRANEFRQDGPKPVRGIQQAFSFWSHHGFSQSHQRAHRLGELLCQTNCESPCHLQEDILHPGNLPAQPQFTGHTQQDARKLFLGWQSKTTSILPVATKVGELQGFRFPLGWTLEIRIASWSATRDLIFRGIFSCIRYGWAPCNCRVFWITLVIGRGCFLIRGGVIHCVSCTFGACEFHRLWINLAIQCVQEVRLQPMSIEIMNTRYYDELPILYTHVKEDLVASMSMNKCWGPIIIGCTQPERRSVTISSITIQVFTGSTAAGVLPM